MEYTNIHDLIRDSREVLTGFYMLIVAAHEGLDRMEKTVEECDGDEEVIAQLLEEGNAMVAPMIEIWQDLKEQLKELEEE